MTSNAAVPLSHDRQVSIDSCSNLVIDERGSTAGAGAGGGFPNPPTSPPSGYAPLPREEQLTTDFDSTTSRRNLPSDQQHGFTPFILAPSSIEDSSPSVPHIQSNGGSGNAEDISQSRQQQLLQESENSDPLLSQACQEEQSSEDKAATSVNNGQTLSTQKSSKQKRRNYNAYSSDDDDDVFLPNPPPKSQADRCTIAMETDEEKSTVVKELEQEMHDKNLSIMDDDEGALVIDEGAGAASDGGTIAATETEGEMTTTEEEVDVINDSQNEKEDKNATKTPPAIKPGKYTSDTLECKGFSSLSSA